MKILVADAYPLMREGLCAALRDLNANPDTPSRYAEGPATVLEAEDAGLVENAVASHPDLDLVLLDLRLPGAGDLRLLRSLCGSAGAGADSHDHSGAHPDLDPGPAYGVHQEGPEGTRRPRVVVLSESEDPALMQRCLDSGAAGYIPKSSSKEILLCALRLVLAGGAYFPERLIKAAGRRLGAAGSDPIHSGDLAALTHRQREVLGRLCQGRSNKQIGQELGLSENTVKVHVADILHALGAHNRTEAVIDALRMGFKATDE